jgi:anti-anti-sigma factor
VQVTAQPAPALAVDQTPSGTEILTLDGCFDADGDAQLVERLAGVLASSDADLVVDLRGVTSVDAETLRALRQTLRDRQQLSREIVLVRPNERVWWMFEVVGYDRAFPSVSCLQEALLGAAPHA